MTDKEKLNEAMSEVQKHIAFYEGMKSSARKWHYFYLVVTIAATALTPVLINAPVERWVVTLAPALAIIATLVSEAFQYKESWRRRARAVEALKREVRLFRLRCGRLYAPPVTEEDAIRKFVVRTERVYETEQREWYLSREKSDKTIKVDAG